MGNNPARPPAPGNTPVVHRLTNLSFEDAALFLGAPLLSVAVVVASVLAR